MSDPLQSGERVYKGIAVSAGICHGKVLVLHAAPRWRCRNMTSPESGLAGQVERLQQALVETRQQILEVQRQVSQALNAKDASIFDAHLLVLEDPTLIDSVTSLIYQKKINVEAAFHEFAEKYQATLRAINDAYLQERAADMRDVTSRILDNLMGRRPRHETQPLLEPCILIAEDLPPSEVALLNRKNTLGFATDVGSKTSHSAIMARSLQLPAVVGLQTASQKIQSGASALLDGYGGLVIVNPSEQTLFEYGQVGPAAGLAWRKSCTSCNSCRPSRWMAKQIVLSANIEQIGDLEAVKFHGAEGVGLFRTEYLFINRESLPTEEEQYPGLSPAGRGVETPAGHHPHAGFGRRQIPFPSQAAGGDEPVSGLARHPVLPGGTRDFSRPTPRHSAGQHRSKRQADVPHDLRRGRVGTGQRPAGGIQGRTARGEHPLRSPKSTPAR